MNFERTLFDQSTLSHKNSGKIKETVLFYLHRIVFVISTRANKQIFITKKLTFGGIPFMGLQVLNNSDVSS